MTKQYVYVYLVYLVLKKKETSPEIHGSSRTDEDKHKPQVEKKSRKKKEKKKEKGKRDQDRKRVTRINVSFFLNNGDREKKNPLKKPSSNVTRNSTYVYILYTGTLCYIENSVKQFKKFYPSLLLSSLSLSLSSSSLIPHPSSEPRTRVISPFVLDFIYRKAVNFSIPIQRNSAQGKG